MEEPVKQKNRFFAAEGDAVPNVLGIRRVHLSREDVKVSLDLF